MRSFSYCIVIVLGTYIGYHAIGLAKVYLWVNIVANIGTLSPTASKIIINLLSIPGWGFLFIALFRVYVCIRQKQIVIPDNYAGIYYKMGLTIASLLLLALFVTIVAVLSLSAGGMSGVPLAMALLPMGLLSTFLMLRSEIPEIRGYLRKTT